MAGERTSRSLIAPGTPVRCVERRTVEPEATSATA
jgi:hypothetical protein